MGRSAPGALLATVLVLTLVSSCAAPRTEVADKPSSAAGEAGDLSQLSGWRVPAFSDDMAAGGLLEAVTASVAYYDKQNPDRLYRFGKNFCSAADLKRSLETFAAVVRGKAGVEEWSKAIKKQFVTYAAGGNQKEVMVTGYYEPVLYGSRLPGIENNVPIYGLPTDMITVETGQFAPGMKGTRMVGRYQNGALVPYYSRYEIERLQVLRGRGCELAWISDPVEAFFLQIQGSGKIMMPDGRQVSISYAGSNGRPYRSIGKLLVETGKIPASEMSMFSLKRYFKSHPQELETASNYNDNYVFFQEVPDGPRGSIGVLLTPERSIATDADHYPPGALAYLETEIPIIGPDGRAVQWKKIARFVLNQDAGGAIKGPASVDLFWGSGEEAGKVAGWMNRAGRLYFLAPKPVK